MKIKNLFVSSALALASAVAAAGTVNFSMSGLNGNFSDSHGFHLDAGQLFSGTLSTVSRLENDISIEALVLSNGVNEYRFDGISDLYRFVTVTSVANTTIVKNKPVVEWTHIYTLSPIFLTAGDWLLTVSGNDDDSNKFNGSYTASLNAVTDVPEPQSAALVFGALAALGFAGRRGKRAAR